MAELIHTSRIKIYQDKRPLRRAYIEDFEEPVLFGVHGGIKHFYKMEPEQDIPATLDYMVAAVGGWLTGTLAGVLEARGIPSFPDKLTSNVEGDIENIDGIIRITKIRVKYNITIPLDKKEAANRALELHQDKCPAAVSVKDAIQISWSADIEEEAE